MDDANKPLMGINDFANGWNEYHATDIKLEGYRQVRISTPFTNESEDHYALASLVVNHSLLHVAEIPPKNTTMLTGQLVVVDSETINVSVFYKLSRRVSDGEA